jgi:3-isopropylmalate/(R)-2-methylmalate dehydratase small subunit
MKPFTNFESHMVPLAINNIDTDQIIPARFLKTTTKQGLDKQPLCDWRYDAQGNRSPDFILNQPRVRGAQVLLAGDNFGCGNSREHAAVASDPDAVVKIDLANQTLTTPGGRKVEFPIDGFSKHCLLEGVDELGYILKHEPYIAAYEARRVGSIDTLVSA